MKIIDIKVPNWGLDMEEATVTDWFKQVGDSITTGEPILTMETDKASGEVEAEVSGVLVEILANPGDVVKTGDLLGRMEING